MIEFFLILFAAMGLSHIIVETSLLSSVKTWLSDQYVLWDDSFNRTGKRWHWYIGAFFNRILEMSNCYQCSGVWAGWFIGSLAALFGQFSWINVLLLGFANAIFSPLSTVIITFFNLKNTESLDGTKEEVNSPRN
jgi:hypothetical protein